jgi:hypothetical protein
MSTKQRSATEIDAVVRDAVARTLAIVGLAGIALIHLLDAHDTFASTPYKGWLYVALIVGSIATAAALARRSEPRLWAIALMLPLGAMLAFIYSRTAGLPGSADDIGNWWEPLGLASLFVEGALVGLSGVMLGNGARIKASTPTIAAVSRARARSLPRTTGIRAAELGIEPGANLD